MEIENENGVFFGIDENFVILMKPPAFGGLGQQILVYERSGVIFAFNFSPSGSQESYFVRTGKKGNYAVCLTTDEECFGGWDRIAKMTYTAERNAEKEYGFKTYIPARTAICFKKV